MNLEAVNAVPAGGLEVVPPAGGQQSGGDFIAILLQMLGKLLDNPAASLPVEAEMPDAESSIGSPAGERLPDGCPACFSGEQWELEALLSGIAPPVGVLPEAAGDWQKIQAAAPLPVADAGRCDGAGAVPQREAALSQAPAVIFQPGNTDGMAAGRVQALWQQAAAAVPLPDEAGFTKSPVQAGRPELAVAAGPAGAAGSETAGNTGPVSAAAQQAPAFSTAAESRPGPPAVPVEQSPFMELLLQPEVEAPPEQLRQAAGERNPQGAAVYRWHGEPGPSGVELPAAGTASAPDTAGSASRGGTVGQPLHESVMEQLKVRLLLIKEAGPGPAAVRFRLHPPALGEVTVRVQLAGQGRVAVDIVTESALVREIFEAGLGELRLRFEQMQIPLERVDLYTAGQGGSDGALQNRGYFSPGQPRAGPRAAAGAGDDLAAAARGDPVYGSIDLWA